MSINRGKIYNTQRAKQLRDFSGLRFGNITPTDIDGLIEYKNKAYVIIELKYRENELPPGQKLALERLADNLQKSGKTTLLILASHNQTNPNDEIDVANSTITSYRYKGKWYLQNQFTVLELVKSFLNWIESH